MLICLIILTITIGLVNLLFRERIDKFDYFIMWSLVLANLIKAVIG